MPDQLAGPGGAGTGFRAAVAAAVEAAGASADSQAGPSARDLWRSLGRHGVIGALFAAPDGADSGDPDPVKLDVLLSELDARCGMGVVLSVCVQVALALPLLAWAARSGGAAASAADRVRRGDAVLAVAVTDAGVAGSDVLAAATAVTMTPGHLVLSGAKDWIANAAHCDYVLVLSRQRDGRHFTSFSWVLVPSAAPGVATSPAAADRLFDGAGVAHLRFSQVRLPADHLAGPPYRGLAMFARQVRTERLASALWTRALCRRVLAETHRWLGSRRFAEGKLWDNAVIRDRFARCLVEWLQLDALCDAYCGAAGRRAPDATAMVLKVAAGQGADMILGECARLRGADGFRPGGEALIHAEAGMFGIAGGATGAMLAAIADHAGDLLAADSCR